MNDKMEKSLNKLEELEKAQLETAKKMLDAYNGSIYAVDLFMSAAINRSIALSKGFRNLIISRNLICAGAILRLQIDTAIRVFAGTLVENTDRFVRDVLNGQHIRKMKDRDGNRMTDRHLIEKLSDEYPWLPKVYDKTSSYIHLSDTHLFSSVQIGKAKNRTISVKISPLDREEIPEKLYIEAIDAFIAATEMLIRWVDGWIFTKSNPELAAEMKAKSVKKG